MYDSGPQVLSDDESDEEEEEEDRPEPPRVLIFATRKNIEILCESHVWFLDRTFKTAPNISAQLFTIIGLRKRLAWMMK